MGTTPFRVTMALVASVALLGASGCSKKSVQSGGDTQSSQQSKTAKSESVEGSKSGVGNFPDTSMQSGGGSGLRGLDKNPSEERVGGSGMGGSLLAKADTGDTSGRQLDEIRAEQAASAAAGLLVATKACSSKPKAMSGLLMPPWCTSTASTLSPVRKYETGMLAGPTKAASVTPGLARVENVTVPFGMLNRGSSAPLR